MKKLDFLKLGVELVVSAGVGSIVGNAIRLSIPDNATKWKRISMGVGGFVLSSMVSDMASKYATDRIDMAAASAQAIKTKVKEAVEQAKAEKFAALARIDFYTEEALVENEAIREANARDLPDEPNDEMDPTHD